MAGSLVDVGLADGVTAQFEVTSVATYLKATSRTNPSTRRTATAPLQLVTCGGAFDSATGHYLSNTVVYTSLVALIPPVAVP